MLDVEDMNHSSSVRSLLRFFAIAFAFLMTSCSGAHYLRTAPADSSEVTGTYTLILYGCRYGSDIENVSILARDAGKYTFEVYAPDFDYKIKKNLPAKEALEEAENFVRCHYAARQSRLSEILAPEGGTIGYEIRPLYTPLEFGYSDILDIYYLIKDGKVTVTISLKRELRQPLMDRDTPFFFRMRR